MNPSREDLEQRFKYALEHSVIHRTRKADLFTFGTTKLPYIFIAESSINPGDIIIRKGEIATEKPTIMMGDSFPSFEGFDGDYTGQEQEMSILFGRTFHFPNMRYQNKSATLEVVSGELQKTIDEEQHQLDAEGNYRTAVISGPEDCWAFSLIIYASEMTQRSAKGNLKDIFERQNFNPGF